MIALTISGERTQVERASRGAVAAARSLPPLSLMAADKNGSIPLAPDGEHVVCCRIALARTTGWDVQLEIDERIVNTTHCGEWHRVERICCEMQRVWEESHTAPSARR